MRVHRGSGGTHRGVENSGEEVLNDIDGDEAGRSLLANAVGHGVAKERAVKPGPQLPFVALLHNVVAGCEKCAPS